MAEPTLEELLAAGEIKSALLFKGEGWTEREIELVRRGYAIGLEHGKTLASATAPLALPSPELAAERRLSVAEKCALWAPSVGDDLRSVLWEAHHELVAAEADATRLREALEFYAKKGEWLDEGGVYHRELAPCRDFGYIAAEALALSGGGAANKEHETLEADRAENARVRADAELKRVDESERCDDPVTPRSPFGI